MPEMTDMEVQEQLKKMLVESKAWLEGHFKLTSGRHSGNYMQCAMLLRFPKYAAFAGGEIAKRIAHLKPDFIVSPALGGLIIGHEVARALDVPFLFCERQDGNMTLRRFPMPVGKTFVAGGKPGNTVGKFGVTFHKDAQVPWNRRIRLFDCDASYGIRRLAPRAVR